MKKIIDKPVTDDQLSAEATLETLKRVKDRYVKEWGQAQFENRKASLEKYINEKQEKTKKEK